MFGIDIGMGFGVKWAFVLVSSFRNSLVISSSEEICTCIMVPDQTCSLIKNPSVAPFLAPVPHLLVAYQTSSSVRVLAVLQRPQAAAREGLRAL